MAQAQVILEAGEVQFTLRYRGPLRATGNRADKEAKHRIRMYFHRQLMALWMQDGRFGARRNQSGGFDAIDPSTLQFPTTKGRLFDVRRPLPKQPTISDWFYRRELGSLFFVPIVNEIRGAQVHVAMRLHLRAIHRGIIFRGDLDNRLKTLFDALTMPTQEQDLPESLQEGPAIEHVFCLLDDDQRITKLSVDSMTLLGPEESNETDHVEIECDVTIQPIRPMEGNYAWMFP